MMNTVLSLCSLLLISAIAEHVAAFNPVLVRSALFLGQSRAKDLPPSASFASIHRKPVSALGVLKAAGDSEGEGGKKKKRKRKRKAAGIEDAQQSTTTPSPPPIIPDPVIVSMEKMEGAEMDLEEEEEELDEEISLLEDIANFKFKPGRDIVMDDTVVPTPGTKTKDSESVIPLPDIREARKRKQMEEEIARMEEEQAEKKVRIKRSDRKAFIKLLEQQPFADADPSFFEEEEYNVVNALLGEGARPFIGIPSGPLQVGHFIGALAIVLMGFVEYPGFPLTNLPQSLREALQGGLGVVYTINAVLAVLSTFKASERGQPKLLWAAKTLSVGGLAYDQLSQLPTLEQMEKMKSQKGKRAVKNRK